MSLIWKARPMHAAGMALTLVFSAGVSAQGTAPQGSSTQGPSMGSATEMARPSEAVTPPGGIPVGPMVAYPTLDVSAGNNSNLFSSNINKRSSNQTIVSPAIKFEAKPGTHKFDITFRLDGGTYWDSRNDDYTNYSAIANADLAISGRAGLKVRAEYLYAVDPRGSNDRAASATPDEYVNQGIGGIFSYGAPGAQGRIEIDGAAFTRRYQNNRNTTVISDRDTTQLGATFLWRVAPKTEILGLVQRRDIDYILSTSTQDSTETRYQAGVKWEATAKTTGIFKAGRLEKEFNTGARTNFSGASWDAIVRWSPLTYSVWDFTTSKQTNESTGTGDFLLTQYYGAVWNHAWNSRLSTAANASWREDEFRGTGGGRMDKTSVLGAKATYQWQRWLRLGAEYTYTDRTSNNSTFDFSRHLIMFTAGATM